MYTDHIMSRYAIWKHSANPNPPYGFTQNLANHPPTKTPPRAEKLTISKFGLINLSCKTLTRAQA